MFKLTFHDAHKYLCYQQLTEKILTPLPMVYQATPCQWYCVTPYPCYIEPIANCFCTPSPFAHCISNPCIWYYDPLHPWYIEGPAYGISTPTAYGILTPLPKL